MRQVSNAESADSVSAVQHKLTGVTETGSEPTAAGVITAVTVRAFSTSSDNPRFAGRVVV